MRRLDDPEIPGWFKLWVGLCVVIVLCALGLAGWLVVAVIEWIGRH